MRREVILFDTIVVKSNDGHRLLSLNAFLDLPLNERIVYILQRQVEFFADGRPVEREVALRSLRAATAARV